MKEAKQINPSNFGQGENFWDKYKWLVIFGIIIVIIILIVFGLYKFAGNNGVDPNQVTPPVQTLKLPGELYLEIGQSEIKVGEEIRVDIFMNTKDSNITAASGYLLYDRDSLEAVRVDTGNSVLSMGAPSGVGEDGSVYIVRGSPGDRNYMDSDDGFTGGSGLLGSVIFKAKKLGISKVGFIEAESRLVLDDGNGTSMIMSYRGVEVEVK
jgi:hypothetical protein